MLLFPILTIHCCIVLGFGNVNIIRNGAPWMCNHEPEGRQTISNLSQSDQQLINKLEQVQVVHRHGSRIGSDSISSFLPNSGLKYDCNITSVVTRQYKNNNYYTNSSKQLMNLQKIYVDDEQIIEGNCKYRQSVKYLIPQQQANANHIKNAYIGNQRYHLFNQSVLNEIALNLAKYSQDKRLILSTTDYERTIASLTVITSELFANIFNNNNINISDIIINTNVHDVESDPYHPNYIASCIEQQQFKEWDYAFNHDPLLQNTAADQVIESDFGNTTISAYIKEGGNWKSDKVGIMLLYPYCAGMSLPLTNSTFWNAVQLSYEWGASYVNTTYGKNQTECYNHFMNIPMLYKMQSDINMLTNNGYPRLVIHSAHDSTIIRLMQSLGIYDNKLIIFGEMVTFEIYSAKNNADLYYFRITRKGQFIPYPYCDYQNGTELCDLDILLQHSFNDVVSQNEWSNKLCSNVLTDCRCGYCINIENTTESPMISTTETSDSPCNDDNSSTNSFNASGISFIVGILIGIGIGLISTLLIGGIIIKFCLNKKKSVHTQLLLKDETL